MPDSLLSVSGRTLKRWMRSCSRKSTSRCLLSLHFSLVSRFICHVYFVYFFPTCIFLLSLTFLLIIPSAFSPCLCVQFTCPYALRCAPFPLEQIFNTPRPHSWSDFSRTWPIAAIVDLRPFTANHCCQSSEAPVLFRKASASEKRTDADVPGAGTRRFEKLFIL